jgi:hypothetical protein
MCESLGKNCTRKIIAAVLLIVAVVLLPSLAKGVNKISKQDIIDLLTGDVSSQEIAAAARKSGISFQITPDVEKEIRAAGGTEDLIGTLRSISPALPPPPTPTPQAPGPAVLMIESNPGQSQVYIDDEPVGSTSQAGRLKLSQLATGQHRVRISMNGYQDHEEAVRLSEGQVSTVAVTLQPSGGSQTAPGQEVGRQTSPGTSDSLSLPEEFHFCGLFCNTWKLQKGRYVNATTCGSFRALGASVWTVEKFTRDSVILHRLDFPPLQIYIANYTGKVSSDGNSIVDGAIDGIPQPFKLTWGAALNSIPGCRN